MTELFVCLLCMTQSAIKSACLNHMCLKKEKGRTALPSNLALVFHFVPSQPRRHNNLAMLLPNVHMFNNIL